MPRPTAAQVRSLFIYSPQTGRFLWRSNAGRHGRIPAGSVAGYSHDGYIMLTIGNIEYRAHIISWLYVHGEWPTSDIDHRDLCRSNNAISNLREASRSGNGANRAKFRNNRSGYKGVSYYKGNGKWRAAIGKDWGKQHLGYFDTPEEAHDAYMKAARELHGEFARAG